MNDQRGFTLTEILISFALLLVGLVAAASLLVTGAKVNRSQQMTVEVQSNTRNTMSVIVQSLRSAGWDPMNVSVPTVALDSNASDGISEITVYADLNADTDLDDDGETLLIRHVGDRVEWRRFADAKAPFQTIGLHITNDEDGDGTVAPMFTPDDAANPTRILVKITGQSASPDPDTRRFIRYTVTSEVLLRRSSWS